jgi:oxygen-dependent protoporphyrinogen oxidase
VNRVVIVGGGISGLAAAHALEAQSTSVAVTLLEASDRLGGTLRSERWTLHDAELVLDVGADGWVASKPQATALARKVGLAERLLNTIPDNRGLYLAWNGKLRRMPEGLVLGVPTRWKPVLESELFTAAGKARMLLEPYIPARVGRSDESIVSFITRRLGQELAERVGTPLLGGIVSGEAAELSIRATFPQLVEAERRDGSLVRSAQKARAARDAAGDAKGGEGSRPVSAFRSLEGGIETLVHAVAGSLTRTEIRKDTPVASITRDAHAGYEVRTASGELLRADAVFVGCPFGVARQLLSPISARLTRAFAPLRETGSVAVLLAYPRRAIRGRLDATGFLVPRTLGSPVAATTWLSQKWPGRAPADTVIVRAFLRSHLSPRDDQELARLAHDDLVGWMHITGEPELHRVARWTRPFLQVGHLDRMAAVQDALAEQPHLYVGGSGYAGVGIPDAIAQGQAAAARISGAHAGG